MVETFSLSKQVIVVEIYFITSKYHILQTMPLLIKTQKWLLILLIFLASCGHPSQNNNIKQIKIQKVTVAISGLGCVSTCPFQALSVDSLLNLNYYGGSYAKKQGYF